MSKNLLFHLDTDPMPSVFDTVVAYDGGADHVQGYGGVTPENVTPLIQGTIFTRPPKEKSTLQSLSAVAIWLLVKNCSKRRKKNSSQIFVFQ